MIKNKFIFPKAREACEKISLPFMPIRFNYPNRNHVIPACPESFFAFKKDSRPVYRTGRRASLAGMTF